MRSLFQKKEEKIVLSSSQEQKSEPVVAAEKVAEDVSLEAEKTEKQILHRPKHVITLQNRQKHRRWGAIGALVVSLAIGIRWYTANLEPFYPETGSDYPIHAVPKWGEMTQPNAAFFYQAGTDAFRSVYPTGSYGYGTATGYKTIMDEPVSVQKTFVERAQPAFKLLRQGMQYSYYPDGQTNWVKTASPLKGEERAEPNFTAIREMSRLLAAEANVRASTGDTAGALSSSLDIMRLGVDVGQGHSLLEGMIGYLVQGIGAREGMRHVEGLSATEARDSVQRLEKMMTNQRTFGQILTAERDYEYEVIKNIFRDGSVKPFLNSIGGAESDAISEIEGRLIYTGGAFVYTRQGVVDDYASAMEHRISRAQLPYQEAKRLTELPYGKYPLARILTPDTQRAQLRSVENDAYTKVLLLRLAVQAYKAEHSGTVPASLKALTEGAHPYLKALPLDPFSKGGAEFLRYNPENGDVYSVGENGIDDRDTGDDARLNKPD